MKKGIKLPNAAFTIILINTIVTGQGRVMRKGSEDVDGGERRSSGPRKGPLARPGSACRTMPGQLAKEGDPSPVNGRPRRPIRVGTQTFFKKAIMEDQRRSRNVGAFLGGSRDKTGGIEVDWLWNTDAPWDKGERGLTKIIDDKAKVVGNGVKIMGVTGTFTPILTTVVNDMEATYELIVWPRLALNGERKPKGPLRQLDDSEEEKEKSPMRAKDRYELTVWKSAYMEDHGAAPRDIDISLIGDMGKMIRITKALIGDSDTQRTEPLPMRRRESTDEAMATARQRANRRGGGEDR